MVCKNCGAELKEGLKFCGTCGQELNVNQEANDFAKEQVTETKVETVDAGTVIDQSETADTYYQQPVVQQDDDGSGNKKKKRSKKPLIITLVAVVVLGVLVFLLKDTIIAWAMNLAPAKTQLKYTYSSTAKDIAEDIDNQISTYEDNANTDIGAKGQIALKLSESAMEMVEEASGIDGLSDLNNASFDFEISMKDNKYGMFMDLLVNTEKIVSAEFFMDMEEGLIAINVPELDNGALMAEMDTSEYDPEAMYMETISAFIPEEGVIKKLLPKYIEICFNELKDVEKNNETLEVSGVSQKAKALKAEINGDAVRKMLIAVLEAAKDDKDIENYLKQVMDAYSSYMFLGDMSWDDMEDEFYDEIDAAVEELEDMDGEDFMGDQSIYVTTWVDSKFDIIGLEISTEEEEFILFAGQATDGNDVGYEVLVEQYGYEYLSISGEGTKKDDKYTGEAVLNVEGEEYLYFDFEDCLSTDEKLEGKVTVSASEMLYEAVGFEDYSFLDLAISFDIASTKDAFELALGVEASGAELGTLTISAETCEPKKVEIPEDGTYDEYEWEENADISAIEDNLMKILPDELIELLEEESYTSDYYYEENYDYYDSYDSYGYY